jgi:hypothetical protein
VHDCTPQNLFQLHEKQYEDRPDSDCHGELYDSGIAHGASTGQRKRQQHHRKSGKYSDKKSASRVHGLTSGFFFSSRKQMRGHCWQAEIVHRICGQSSQEV